jgi:CRISPR-associated protein Cmr6
VCTVQLPEVLVFVFTACSQSIEEGLRFIDGVQNSRQFFPHSLGRLTILPLLSRWDGEDEVDLAAEWQSRIEPIIFPYVESWLPRDFSVRRVLEELRVPHVARFSFGEQLPVLTHSITDPKLPGRAFNLLAQLISSDLGQAGRIIDPTYKQISDPTILSDADLIEVAIDNNNRTKAIDAVASIDGSFSIRMTDFLTRMADILFRNRNLQLADEMAGKAVESARRLCSDNNSPPKAFALSRALLQHADISKNLSGIAISRELYQEAVNIIEDLLALDSENRSYNLKLLELYDRLGSSSWELYLLGRSGADGGGKSLLNQAFFAFENAITIGEKLLADNMNHIQVKNNLCASLSACGDILAEHSHLDEALGFYNKAHRLRDDLLTEDPENEVYITESSTTLEKIGDLFFKKNKYEEASLNYDQAIKQLYSYLRISESSDYHRRLGSVLSKVANLHYSSRDFPMAIKIYSKAIAMLKAAPKAGMTEPQADKELTSLMEEYESVLREYGRLQQSKGIAGASRVPMQYRAQVTGRCQRQYIKKPRNAPPGWRSDLQRWIDEWVERVDRSSPFSSRRLRIVEAQIDWRLISNSGVDEGIIRPVIGAGGWPMIPGSGIKGLFRRACDPHRLERWCGSSSDSAASTGLQPGILRFHGAWPADPSWAHGLLDVAHPQQNWQVGFTNGGESHSAFGVVSLFQPKLQIGLSCSDPDLTPEEWDEVVKTLKRALGAGLGGRTCVGYGSSGRLRGDVLFQCSLEGQGPAAKLLNDSAEFRPTMFRAAIRGMALRLFGGLTDSEAALRIVGKLFGSLGKEQSQNVGLLATAYTDAVTNLGSYGRGSWEQPIYATSGVLQWRLTHSPGPDTTTALLADLLAALHGLTMSLAGFGKGWRRPDHRIFYHHRYDKTPIGCHWQWREPQDLPAWIHVQSPRDLARLLQRARQLASQWLDLNQVRHGEPAPWREVMHPQCMRIWIRQASGPDDAVAVAWFHHSPAEGEHSSDPTDPRDLKRTRLAGQMNQVGLIWNRLLPLMEKRQTSKSAAAAMPASPMARPTAAALARPGSPRQLQTQPPRPRGEVSIPAYQGAYLESLVLHSLPGNARPEESLHYQRFIDEMNRGAGADFEALDWS